MKFTGSLCQPPPDETLALSNQPRALPNKQARPINTGTAQLKATPAEVEIKFSGVVLKLRGQTCVDNPIVLEGAWAAALEARSMPLPLLPSPEYLLEYLPACLLDRVSLQRLPEYILSVYLLRSRLCSTARGRRQSMFEDSRPAPNGIRTPNL